MIRLVDELGLRLPVVAAPMAGGPTTPALVSAAAQAGALAFLSGGYLTAEILAGQVEHVRGAGRAFGVNLFVPGDTAVDHGEYARYRESLRPEASRSGVDLPAEPVEDDDDWAAKLDLVTSAPVPVVSFTFALPDRRDIARLRARGTVVVQTVTAVDEARESIEAGVDALAVQGPEAGGHSGSFAPATWVPASSLGELLAAIRPWADRADVPVIAAGGLSARADVAEVLRSGASLAMVGTALLLADEAGTNLAHRRGLRDTDRGAPVLTRAFTGRPARGLPNEFMAANEAAAPFGYPAIHHLTRPIRQRANGEGDPGRTNLWAGTGWRRARTGPVADLLTALGTDV